MQGSQIWFIRLFIVFLSVAMIGAFLAGSRLGRRFHKQSSETFGAGIQTVGTAIYGLLALLLAFTFSGAADRFDERRKLIVEEANAIHTAYRRLDLLPVAAQAGLRANFRRYVDSRIAIYRVLPNSLDAARALVRESEGLQNTIWNEAVDALKQAKETSTTVLVIGALDPMIDINRRRLAATEIHPPRAIYGLLAIFSVMSVFLVGFEMAKDEKPSGVHAIGLTVAVVLTIAVIINYEYPRSGFIRIDPMDHVLVDVRSEMK
jgi:hypothetical protein